MARNRKIATHKRTEKGYGSVRKKEVKRKDGTSYRSYELRYSLGKDDDGNEQRRSESFRTEAEAKERQLTVAAIRQSAKNHHWSYAELEDALFPKLGGLDAEHAGVSEGEKSTTVDAWFEIWLENYMRGTESTRRKYKDDFYRYVSPQIGKCELKNLRPLEIQMMVNHWQDPDFAIKKALSNKYVRDIHAMMKSCFQKAVTNNELAANPCNDTVLPKDTKAEKGKKKIKISLNQASQIIDAIRTAPHANFYLFSAFFGLRVMENLGLTMEDIDMDNHVIHLRFQLRRDFDEVPFAGETKHFKILKDKDPRDIYFDDEIAKILQDQIRHEQLKKQRLGDKWPADELERGDLLFSNDNGSYLSYSTIRDCFYRRVKPIMPEFRVHDLRHMYAAIAYSSGATTEIIAKHIGHEDAKLTESVYLSIPHEIQKESAADVGRTIAELLNTPTNS